MKKRFLILLTAVLLFAACGREFVPENGEAYRVTDTPLVPEETEKAPKPPYGDVPDPAEAAAPDPSEAVEPADPTPTPYIPTRRERYDIPNEVAFDRQDGLLTITGTAPVLVPELTGLPLLRVCTADFSEERVRALYRACRKDAPAHEYAERLDLSAYSREELSTLLEAYEDYRTNATADVLKSAAQRNIEDAKAQLAQAPASVSRKPLSLTLTEQTVDYSIYDGPVGSVYGLTVYTTPEKHYGDAFSVRNRPVWERETEGYYAQPILDAGLPTLDEGTFSPFYDARFSFVRYRASTRRFFSTRRAKADVTDLIRSPGVLPKDCTMQTAPSAASALVEAFLNEADMMDFRVERVRLHEQHNGSRQWYIVTCRRMCEGLPVSVNDLYPDPPAQDAAADARAASWQNESLAFLVSDGVGIRAVWWDNPIEVSGRVSDDCTLLPFDEIQSIAAAVLYDRYRGTTVRRTATVLKAELVLQCAWDGKSANEGTLVPVWNFVYDYARTNGSDGYLLPYTLSINAMTGEVIGFGKDVCDSTPSLWQ